MGALVRIAAAIALGRPVQAASVSRTQLVAHLCLGLHTVDPKPDHFASDFQAIEVLNAGDYAENFELYLDLIGRGYAVTLTGVSDAHGYRNGVGENLTWLHAAVDAPGALTDAILSTKMQEGQTIVSRGPFLDVRIDGVWAPGSTVTGTQIVDVTVEATSFV